MTSTDAFQGGFLSPPLFVNDHFTKKKKTLTFLVYKKKMFTIEIKLLVNYYCFFLYFLIKDILIQFQKQNIPT